MTDQSMAQALFTISWENIRESEPVLEAIRQLVGISAAEGRAGR